MYSIAALNASHQEGDMISMNVSTTAVTPPLAPTIRLTGHTVSSLNISVTLDCDTGGKRPSELEYFVVQNDTVLQTSTFDCCNFTVQNLSANEYYLVYVGVGNSAGTSERAWGNYSTSTGIPLTPLLSVKRVNAYSAELQLGNLDQEIVSFDVMNRRHEDDSWTIKTTECGFEQCPSLYRLYPLLANTTYDIYLRVNGPNGASSSDVETFTTASIPNTTLGTSEPFVSVADLGFHWSTTHSCNNTPASQVYSNLAAPTTTPVSVIESQYQCFEWTRMGETQVLDLSLPARTVSTWNVPAR